jgi:hypothetical protein
MDRPDPGELRGQLLRYRESAVGAGILSDGDDETKGKIIRQIRM